MRWYKKILWILVSVVGVTLFTIAIYGLGRDIVNNISHVLTALVVGLFSFAMFIIIGTIFALGIIHIMGWFKEANSE